MLPETVLQFGTGRFLRAFADAFIQYGNEHGQEIGRVVVVQSTPGRRADTLAHQHGGYHVLVRGIENGQVVDRVERVQCISRALTAGMQWDEVLATAASPALKMLISNTTEAGYATDAGDRRDDRPPKSYPARLTQLLCYRYQKGQVPLLLFPCELLERNADKLRDLVVQQARTWDLPEAFQQWASHECTWLNSLVDRIVTLPSDEHPLMKEDPLLIQAEPYALWAIERPRPGWQPPIRHPAVEAVDDLTLYYLRKVRILNGIHTALVGKFMPRGFETVQQALQNPEVMDWVLGLLYEEILPTIAYRVGDIACFARQTLERFANPFLKHRLSDIALHHRDKVQVRLQSTASEYERLFGKPPRRLREAMQQS